MSEGESEVLVTESMKALADDLAALDGREGKGGGLIVRAPNRWMALVAWVMRGYVIMKWLRSNRVPLERIDDPKLREEYAKFVERSIDIARKAEHASRELGKTPIGHEIASWYDDPQYWQCAVAGAGACAALSAGDLVGGIGLGLVAYDECEEYLDSLDRADGGRDDGQRKDDR